MRLARIMLVLGVLALLAGLVLMGISIWTVDPIFTENLLQSGLLFLVPGLFVTIFSLCVLYDD